MGFPSNVFCHSNRKIALQNDKDFRAHPVEKNNNHEVLCFAIFLSCQFEAFKIHGISQIWMKMAG